jgi:hypothetical protein
MKKYLLVILITLCVSTIIAQIKNNIEIDITRIQNNKLLYGDTIITMFMDPVFRNELGLEFVVGSYSPNYGLNIDFAPLFIKKMKLNIGMRHALDKDFILNGGIETQGLLRLLQNTFDLRFDYRKYEILLNDSFGNKFFTIGPIVSKYGRSFGFFVGYCFFDEAFGAELSFSQLIRHRLYKSGNTFKNIGEINAQIGYWDTNLTYDIKLDYFINYSLKAGAGYRKFFDIEEFYVTFRYLIFY